MSSTRFCNTQSNSPQHLRARLLGVILEGGAMGDDWRPPWIVKTINYKILMQVAYKCSKIGVHWLIALIILQRLSEHQSKRLQRRLFLPASILWSKYFPNPFLLKLLRLFQRVLVRNKYAYQFVRFLDVEYYCQPRVHSSFTKTDYYNLEIGIQSVEQFLRWFGQKSDIAGLISGGAIKWKSVNVDSGILTCECLAKYSKKQKSLSGGLNLTWTTSRSAKWESFQFR